MSCGVINYILTNIICRAVYSGVSNVVRYNAGVIVVVCVVFCAVLMQAFIGTKQGRE